uniref:Putative ovule protein n=1 Tax=Solanum chacoense TaxID=4108 RepID=A0A0V0GI87_SOLCH
METSNSMFPSCLNINISPNCKSYCCTNSAQPASNRWPFTFIGHLLPSTLSIACSIWSFPFRYFKKPVGILRPFLKPG